MLFKTRFTTAFGKVPSRDGTRVEERARYRVGALGRIEVDTIDRIPLEVTYGDAARTKRSKAHG